MDRFQINNTLILTDYTHTFVTYVSCCVSYLTLLMQANIKNRKKLQLIQTWFEMSWLYSQYLTFHWKLLVLVSRIQKSRTRDNSFGDTERHISVRPTEMTRPVTVDHLQSWSRIAWIFRSDQTEMVRSIWWTNRNFRNFGFPIINFIHLWYLAWYAWPGLTWDVQGCHKWSSKFPR